MKLTKKEVNIINYNAYRYAELNTKKDIVIDSIKKDITEKKHDIALSLFNELTEVKEINDYRVDFKINNGGVGHLTFYNVTPKEAEEKCINNLLNGAFGKNEIMDNIIINRVYRKVI